MLFSSPLFLFLFLPAVLGGYFLAPRWARNGVLLAASLLFYAWGEPWFIGLMLASAGLDWLLGRGMTHAGDRRRRLLVATGVTANLAILVTFKYTGFLVGAMNGLLSQLQFGLIPIPKLALPLGVSFIVFEKITYLVDLYRRTGAPAPSFRSYLLYVFLFPKLLAGPIVKYHEIADQLTRRAVAWEDLAGGMGRFSVGLAKKVLIADTLAQPADAIFALEAHQLGTGLAWFGLLCFTLQIYFDFSGYSDMAIGLGRLLGFRLRENFNQPYLSTSFTEFWRRWHISLSSWIREYLYVPLGGNRVSPLRAYGNLTLCFLLSGLWHGANWTFVVWGLYHGLFLILDRVYWSSLQARVPRWLSTLGTFILVAVSWGVFRATDLRHAGYYLGAAAGFGSETPAFLPVGADVSFYLLVGLAVILAPTLAPLAKRLRVSTPSAPWSGAVLSLALLFLSACKVANATFNPFLYFRF